MPKDPVQPLRRSTRKHKGRLVAGRNTPTEVTMGGNDIFPRIMHYADRQTLGRCLQLCRAHHEVAGRLLYEKLHITENNRENVFLGWFNSVNNTKANLLSKIKTLQLDYPHTFHLPHSGGTIELPRLQVLIIKWPQPACPDVDLYLNVIGALRPLSLILHNIEFGEHDVNALLPLIRQVDEIAITFKTAWSMDAKSLGNAMDADIGKPAKARFFFPDLSDDYALLLKNSLTDICGNLCLCATSEIDFVIDRKLYQYMIPGKIIEGVNASLAKTFKERGTLPPKVKFTTREEFLVTGCLEELCPRMRKCWEKAARKYKGTYTGIDTESESARESESESASESESESKGEGKSKDSDTSTGLASPSIADRNATLTLGLFP
ncbi:hypothetical protein P7C73_g1257, partial [Tremellales sp. Uapishka_1]